MRIESLRSDAFGAVLLDCSGGVVFSIPHRRLGDLADHCRDQDPVRFLKACAAEGREFDTSDPLIQSLERIDREERALACAARLCARAEQHSRTLEAKLLSKGFGPGEIQNALASLEAEGILDDARYAAAWARARLRRKPEGPRVLAAELRARGIRREDAAAVMESLDFSEILPRAAALLESRGSKRGKPDTRSSLIAQGFAAEAVDAYLEALPDSRNA